MANSDTNNSDLTAAGLLWKSAVGEIASRVSPCTSIERQSRTT
jgi:hypothetical protein